MSWARAVAVLVIIFGFIGYAWYAAMLTSQKLYERGILKESPMPTIDVKAITTQVAQYTAVAITLLAIAIVAKRVVESTRVLGVVKVGDLQRHLLLLGPTGSGKTNTAKQAISLAIRKGVKVIVIDWKGEYVGFVKGATVIRKVNPWDNGGRSPKEAAVLAVETLREITRDIADVSSASAALLLRELVKLYQRGVPKTSDVVSALERFINTAMAERRLAEANMASALLRRMMWLQIDEERSAKNVIGSDRVVVYDLSELGSVYLKTIYSLSILSKTYYEALRQGQSQTLETLIIAEECQNYVRGRRFDDPPSIGERMANELRAYGVGMVLISPDPVQIPWHLSRDVAAVVSIGLQAIPDSVKDIFRTMQVKRIMTGRKAYVYYNGRLKTVSPPKPPRRPIDLKVATQEVEAETVETVETPATTQQPDNQTGESVQATPIEQKEPLEEAPKGISVSIDRGPGKPPLRLEEDEELEET
ncbi:MAG: DUF87 domain-containing protein, partial [Candidatus Caldarchaeum sp.]